MDWIEFGIFHRDVLYESMSILSGKPHWVSRVLLSVWIHVVGFNFCHMWFLILDEKWFAVSPQIQIICQLWMQPWKKGIFKLFPLRSGKGNCMTCTMKCTLISTSVRTTTVSKSIKTCAPYIFLATTKISNASYIQMSKHNTFWFFQSRNNSWQYYYLTSHLRK